MKKGGSDADDSRTGKSRRLACYRVYGVSEETDFGLAAVYYRDRITAAGLGDNTSRAAAGLSGCSRTLSGRRDQDAGSGEGYFGAPLVFGVVAGLIETLIPIDETAEAGGRKIRPNLQKLRREVGGRIVLFALGMCKLGEQLGFFERLFAGGLAFDPKGAELGHVLLNGAVDALFIESQKLEVFTLGDPGVGFGERFVNGNLGGVIPVGRGEGAELAELAEGEDAGFDGAGALEAPVVFGDGLRQFGFEGAYGFEGFADAGAVLVEGFVLFGGEKADLAGEAVTIGVEAGAMLAFFGFGTGGFLSVGDVSG
jgi:hypothetical protein